jgi:hypothetical protein
MEIDITQFFADADPFEFSASRAERGQNAGPETWANALEEAKGAPMLKTEDELAAFRSYVEDFGAWSTEEIVAWSPTECNALFVQMVSGDIREADLDQEKPDWIAYETGVAAGRYAGNLFVGDDDHIYYSLAS